MKNFTRWPWLTYVLMLLLALRVMPVAAQGFSTEAQARLQQVIDSFQNDQNIPFVGGISAAIKVDGLAAWQGVSGYGARNVDESNNLLPGGTLFTKETISRMYSVTKTFTAPLVLELAKEGVFNLNDPVTKYLPLLNIYNPELDGTVTIRQLLAHESGYSDYPDEYMLQIAIAFDPTHIWSAYEMASFVHQLYPAGTVRFYSSTNYCLLGAIVEAATGKPIEQQYRERFFVPLNFKSMYLAVRETIPAGRTLAAPHDNLSPFNPVFQLTGQPTFPDAYTNISQFPFDAVISLAYSGGGLASDVNDLADWGNALFGGRATSKATLDSMLQSISTTPDEDSDYLGYGIFSNHKISATDYFVGHNGRGPGYRSIMFYQPDRKMTIAVLINFYGVDPYEIGKALYAALPDFVCGNQNRKENKIELCFNGKTQCVAREAAPALISKGAFLGACSQSSKTAVVANNLPKQTSEASLAAYPNPFTSTISFTVKANESGPATLSLYDANGRLIKTLFNAVLEKGAVRNINMSAGSLPAGVYIGVLKTQRGVIQYKVLLMK